MFPIIYGLFSFEINLMFMINLFSFTALFNSLHKLRLLNVIGGGGEGGNFVTISFLIIVLAMELSLVSLVHVLHNKTDMLSV